MSTLKEPPPPQAGAEPSEAIEGETETERTARQRRRSVERPGTPVDDVAIDDIYRHGRTPAPTNKK